MYACIVQSISFPFEVCSHVPIRNLHVTFAYYFLGSRLSITVVRTGNSAGETGPTIILCKGTKANKHASFTDEFLVKQGLAPGSTILMTENAYMTDDAWGECTPHLLEGYRKMPVIEDNPEWEIIEFLDGFRSHENNLEANKARTAAKVRSIKEESQTSHACQAYDQETAKQDKKNCADTLAKQRFAKRHDPKGKGLNQWDLVIVVIEIVRMTRKSTWICSFRNEEDFSWGELKEGLQLYDEEGVFLEGDNAGADGT